MKYLGVCIDEHLEWTFHVNQTSQNLAKANAMYSKISHFISEAMLQSIYYAFFH